MNRAQVCKDFLTRLKSAMDEMPVVVENPNYEITRGVDPVLFPWLNNSGLYNLTLDIHAESKVNKDLNNWQPVTFFNLPLLEVDGKDQLPLTEDMMTTLSKTVEELIDDLEHPCCPDCREYESECVCHEDEDEE